MKPTNLLAVFAILLAGTSIAVGQAEPSLENGYKAYGSYQGGNIDSVNLLNGNLTVEIPAPFQYPQRGGLRPRYVFYTTSKDWTVQLVDGGNGALVSGWLPGIPASCVLPYSNIGNQSIQMCALPNGLGLVHTLNLTVTRTAEVDVETTGTTYSVMGFNLVTWDSASHSLYPGSGGNVNNSATQWDSIDGSGYHVTTSGLDGDGVMDNIVVTDREGNQYAGSFPSARSCVTGILPTWPIPWSPDSSGYFPIATGNGPAMYQCGQVATFTTVTDVNGNVFNINMSSGPGDTLGRVFPSASAPADAKDCVSPLPISAANAFAYLGYNGVNQQITLCSSNFPLQTSFGLTGVAEVQNLGSAFPFRPTGETLLTTIILPDVTKWTFAYDSYGHITSLGFPLGGSISYTWTTISVPTNICNLTTPVSRAVRTRTVSDNNGHAYVWTYSWGTVANGSVTNTVTDPLNNDTDHVFTALQGASGCDFFETSTRNYQGTGGSRQLLKQVDTTYSSARLAVDTVSPNTTPTGNVFATDITTTVYPSGKVSKIHRVPDAGPGANRPIFGSVTQELDYDFGNGSPGTLLREVDTTYQWQSQAPYLSAHLLDLPASVVVKDGSGCALSEADTTYDESAFLTPYANVGALPPGTHVAAPNSVRGSATSVTKWLASTSSCNPQGGAKVISHTNWYDTGEPYQTTDPLGHITTHSYDPAYAGAYATKTTNALGQSVSGAYDFNTGLVTSFTNQNGRTSTYAYDSLWRMISAVFPPDSSGNHPETDFTYPNVTTVQRSKKQDMNGQWITNFTYLDGLGRATQTRLVDPAGDDFVDTTYDAAGRVSTVSNPHRSASGPTDGITTTVYDALGRPTQVTKQDASASTVSYSVVPVQNAPGDCTETADEAGHQRLTCVDGLGRLIEVHEPGDNFNGAQATGSFTVNGLLKSQSGVGAVNPTSASAQVTIGGSDAGFYTPPQQTGGCDPNTGVCLPVETIPGYWTFDTGTVHITVNGREYDYVFGGGSSTQDTTASVAYELVGAIQGDGARVVNASVPSGGSVITLTAISAGSAGNNIAVSSGSTNDFTTSPTSSSLSGGTNGSTGVTVYDQGTVSVTVGSGTAGSFTASAPYGPNTNNTAAAVAAALASGLSGASSVTVSAIGAQINLTYNGVGTAGNIAVTSASQSTQTQWTFSPPSFSAAATTLSGGLNAEGPSLDYNYLVTQYSYDALGNLLKVTQKGDPSVATSNQWRVRNFTYDSLGRLLTASNPESGTITYSYDADGNVLQKTDARSVTTSYSYDVLNRLTQKSYSDGSAARNFYYDVTPPFQYNAPNHGSSIGRLTHASNNNGAAYDPTYDPLGRVTGIRFCVLSDCNYDLNVTASYDLAGDLTQMTYPDGETVTYGYDAAGRQASASDTVNGINYATTATYDPIGALTGFLSGNSGSFLGITNSFSFNQRLQPVFVSAATPSQTVLSIGYDFHLGNGNNGNVYALSNNKDSSRSQSFKYDQLNRLTSAQNAGTDCTQKTLNSNQTKYWGNSYGYDAWGNLLTKSVTKCSAENLNVTALANNQLSGYGYDAAGNMTSDPTDGITSATYDAESRIATVTGSGGSTTYTYDADGERVRKDVAGAPSTEYVYFNGEIIAEKNATSGAWTNYVFFAGDRVARRDPGNTVSYYFSDHLKTTDIVTDAQGNIKNESDYYPWGGELQFANGDSNHYKFTGKERDSETGLDYFGARYYSNGLGRFITPDLPFADQHKADPQTWNLYMYVRNNPLRNADPSGRGVIDVVGLANSIKNWWNGGVQRDGGVGKFAKQNGIGAAKGTGSFAVNIARVGVALSQAANGNAPGAVATAMAPGPKALQPSNQTQAQASTAMQTVVLPMATAAIPLGELGAAGSTEATLTRLATQAVDNVGPGSGAAYGTAVHSEFADLVEASTNLSTEVSYKGGQVVEYGTPGSVRVDVVEGPIDAPTCCYDLKTGSATLTPARTAQIQNELPGGSNVPVKEIKPQ